MRCLRCACILTSKTCVFTTAMTFMYCWCSHSNWHHCDLSNHAHVLPADLCNATSHPPLQVFILSTRAGAVGINLTSAWRMVVFDVSSVGGRWLHTGHTGGLTFECHSTLYFMAPAHGLPQDHTIVRNCDEATPVAQRSCFRIRSLMKLDSVHGQGLTTVHNVCDLLSMPWPQVPWNPVHNAQAMARIYRIGQKKPTFVYRLMYKGTMVRTACTACDALGMHALL